MSPGGSLTLSADELLLVQRAQRMTPALKELARGVHRVGLECEVTLVPYEPCG